MVGIDKAKEGTTTLEEVLQATAEDHSRCMGLLDNLFKPKPESGGEKSVENASSESGGEHAASGTKAQFLAPKIYVPRSSVQIVPPAKTQPQGERKLAPVSESSAGPKEIVLTLGDVLSRIPTHFLREGKPDLRRELRFPAEGLAADIARGRAGVYLAEIVAQCPDLFLPEVNGFDDIQIRLPLQKLVEQIARGSGSPPPVSNPLPDSVPAPAPPLASLAPAAPHEEAQIHLSLAAIMRRCPREIIVQPLPPIEESVRVTFPFAPIERQLSTGQVEVSSLRFIAALPLGLMKCFEARAGVKVPLPLEEIFQNLPNQTPPAGSEAPLSKPAAPPDAVTEVTERARVNAKLAESILLEPMFEPVVSAEPAPVLPAPPSIENAIITANFHPAPPVNIAPEVREPIFIAPPVESVRSELREPEKNEAASELAAQLEALAAEDAKIESRLAEEALLAPLPASPLEASPAPFPEMLPEPKSPAAEAPATIPEPASEPAAPSAFRPFAPTLRPPVILQPNTGREELRPAAEAVVSSEPEPPAVLVPTPASEPPSPPPPDFVAPLPPEPLHVESIVSAPAEIAPEPAPPVIETVASTLRIGPPQFRPFVVHAPPIVFAPAEVAASAPIAVQPEIADSVVAEHSPEPVAEVQPVNVEPLPEPIIEPPVERPAAPLSHFSVNEPAAPFLLDGRVREFFPSDEPLSLPRVSQLLAALPGIHGCILVTRSAESHSGEIPRGLDPAVIRDLSQRMRGALSDRAETFGSSEMPHLTLHTEQYSLSLFTRGEACACAIHRARIFLPGVREKFTAVAEELARIGH